MADTPNIAPKDENQIIGERRAKLADLRKAGIAFPNDFHREHLAADRIATTTRWTTKPFRRRP